MVQLMVVDLQRGIAGMARVRGVTVRLPELLSLREEDRVRRRRSGESVVLLRCGAWSLASLSVACLLSCKFALYKIRPFLFPFCVNCWLTRYTSSSKIWSDTIIGVTG